MSPECGSYARSPAPAAISDEENVVPPGPEVVTLVPNAAPQGLLGSRVECQPVRAPADHPQRQALYLRGLQRRHEVAVHEIERANGYSRGWRTGADEVGEAQGRVEGHRRIRHARESLQNRVAGRIEHRAVVSVEQAGVEVSGAGYRPGQSGKLTGLLGHPRGTNRIGGNLQDIGTSAVAVEGLRVATPLYALNGADSRLWPRGGAVEYGQ